MMTAVLREGTEPEWDAAMRERLEAAGGRGGWIGGQLLIPLERLNQRVIVGTCDTRADWHADEAFRDTRSRIEGLEKRPSETNRYEVMAEQRGPA